VTDEKTPRSWAITRRTLLSSGAGAVIVASGAVQAATRSVAADFVISSGELAITVAALSDRAFRVRAAPVGALPAAPSEMLAPIAKPPIPTRSREGGQTRLTLPHAQCVWDDATGCLSFHDGAGKLLLSEAPGSRHVASSTIGAEPTLAVTQGFTSPTDERLYGTGCFQDGHLDIRGLPRRLTQVNTQISQPFVLSSKGYGLLWHNPGMAELNRPDRPITLVRQAAAGAARMADVTTSTGNARVRRRDAEFIGKFTVPRDGRYAFLLNLGRKMSSRHYVEVDGEPMTDLANLWLPPTASFIGALAAGEHSVLVRASDEDVPVLTFAPVDDRTTWSSPVSEGIDYVVIAGPTAADVMAGYHAVLGPQPMMPLWALGYIHCRERFHSSAEILATAREFRARKLPCDMMVQDWQYWGKYGWNAMRFDEDHYPDPAGLVRELHATDMRLMLSVWSKVGKETELGKDVAAKGFYIPGTEWIDFFNPVAARFYARQQTQKLGSLGIDAWWQDATEPENDDLAGRPIYAAPGKTQPGEKRRNLYPLQVSRTVYEAQRRAYPDKRVMILTRSAAPGQQRYGAATWSGDIGHDWETLKRQIPAGLNMGSRPGLVDRRRRRLLSAGAGAIYGPCLSGTVPALVPVRNLPAVDTRPRLHDRYRVLAIWRDGGARRALLPRTPLSLVALHLRFGSRSFDGRNAVDTAAGVRLPQRSGSPGSGSRLYVRQRPSCRAGAGRRREDLGRISADFRGGLVRFLDRRASTGRADAQRFGGAGPYSASRAGR